MRPPLTVSPTMRGVRAVPAVVLLARHCLLMITHLATLESQREGGPGSRRSLCFQEYPTLNGGPSGYHKLRLGGSFS